MLASLSHGTIHEHWTPELLAFITSSPAVTAEHILAHAGDTPESRRECREVDYAQRLVWRYGHDEALRRLNGDPS